MQIDSQKFWYLDRRLNLVNTKVSKRPAKLGPTKQYFALTPNLAGETEYLRINLHLRFNLPVPEAFLAQTSSVG